MINPSTFNYSVPVLSLGVINVDISSTSFDLNVSSAIDVFRTQIKAKRLANFSQNPKAYKLKTFCYAPDNTDSPTIFEQFVKMFPNITAGDYWSIAVRGISSSGLVSPWVQQTVRLNL